MIDRLQIIIDYSDPYVQPLIHSALSTCLPPQSYTVISSTSSTSAPLLQFSSYESIDFEQALRHPTTSLTNAYVIRKALIRKHYLANTVSNWLVKYPYSALRHHVKESFVLELDYAEFLDEALLEAWELKASFARNEKRSGAESGREWWILKPGMSDRGQGIRLFSSEEELQSIFEEWDEEEDDDEDDADSQTNADEPANAADRIVTAQLRHFVAQPYIQPPLLFPDDNDSGIANRKFHIRTYVLAAGSLRVYVYRPMLALFASAPYVSASSSSVESRGVDLAAHLTNTCYGSGSHAEEKRVHAFWDLPELHEVSSASLGKGGSRAGDWKEDVFGQICRVVREVFEAAARGAGVHFQTRPNAFEIFGLDFLVGAGDEGGDGKGGPTAWLLEVNAFPDFGQTGEELKGLIQGLFHDVVDVAVKPFFGLGSHENVDGKRGEGLVKVLDVDLGLK